MKFSSKEDIEAPAADVFLMISDFEMFERSAMRRGAQVTRVDSLQTPAVGMAWKAGFKMRGRQRELDLELTEYESPNGLEIKGVTSGMNVSFSVDLLALSRTRTRMSVELDLKPTTLSARLLIQSLKLAKASLTKRYKLRVAEYAKDMEERYKRVS